MVLITTSSFTMPATNQQNFKEAHLAQLMIHFVGNSAQDEQLKISKGRQIIDEAMGHLLMRYFLNPFKASEYYHFTHSSEVDLNEMYTFATRIFNDPECFYLQSINIAKHLYDHSTHPKICGGELYLIYLTGCMIDGEETEAIGLFKSESKETYLKVNMTGEGYDLISDDGININKLDKGCLIFNLEQEKGYKICIVDQLNKSGEAQYWKDDFLKLKPREDSFYHTENYLKICHGFINDKLKEEYDMSKADEIDIMNKSVNFFKKNDSFDFNSFTKEVIGTDEEVITEFKEYKNQFQIDNQLAVADEFQISTQAVKKQSRVYKSILKLDKNFHVYIHGNKDLIQKGFDDATGLNYYQLYFKEEN